MSTYCTARPSQRTASFVFEGDDPFRPTPVMEGGLPQRLPLHAFCDGDRGNHPGALYSVRALGRGYLVMRPRDNHCSHCGRAVFWARSYAEVGSPEEVKRARRKVVSL